MTFEEFISKKKIDIVRFEKADPGLVTEFRKHFLLMGEKSFDHTKKFWFNKLRRTYHLSSPQKGETQKETSIGSQAEPLSSPTIEQNPAFIPRLEPDPAAEAKEGLPSASPAKKPAFKPRNITSQKATGNADSAETEDLSHTEKLPIIENAKSSTEEVTDEAASDVSEQRLNLTPAKPAFKPRNIPPQTEINEYSDRQKESHSAPVKPAFKPRNIPHRPKVESKQEEIQHSEEIDPIELKTVPSPPDGKNIAKDETKEPPIDPVKTPGFKPRNIKSLADKNATDANRTNSRPGEPIASDTPVVDAKDSPAPSKGLYKPKFNLKSISKTSAKEKESETSDEKDIFRRLEEQGTIADRKPDSMDSIDQEVATAIDSSSDLENENSVPNAEDSPKEGNSEDVFPKPTYKPKFNLKNIKKS